MSRQRSATTCRFFGTPGGCRNAACRFVHTANAGTIPSSPSQDTSNRSSSDRRPSSSSQPPNGVCRFFWQTGACRFAFDCRFKHIAAQQAPASQAQSAGDAGPSMPFLKEGGFSRVGQIGSDVFCSIPSRVMDPNEAHNTLKRFLFDDYRFRKAFDVYAFLVPVLSANSNSPLWVSHLLVFPCSSLHGVWSDW